MPGEGLCMNAIILLELAEWNLVCFGIPLQQLERLHFATHNVALEVILFCYPVDGCSGEGESGEDCVGSEDSEDDEEWTQVGGAECNAPSRRRPFRSPRNQSAMYDE